MLYTFSGTPYTDIQLYFLHFMAVPVKSTPQIDMADPHTPRLWRTRFDSVKIPRIPSNSNEIPFLNQYKLCSEKY